MTQCINLILDRIVEHLTTKMQTEIDPTDLTYADVVKKGLLQHDKASKNVALGVAGGDHDEPEFMDGIVSLEKFQNIAMHVPAREVGGGQTWWRRGVIRIECFFVRERLLEDEAFDAGYEVLGRLMANLENISMTGIVDSYEERAIQLFCLANTFFQSGGAPRTFIFRGKVFWEVLCERP